MKEKELDSLIEHDWGDEWDRLPKVALPAVASTEPAQVTLRVSKFSLAQLRRVAQEKTLPYHALARSWILEAVKEGREPDSETVAVDAATPADTQLNIKLTADRLHAIKEVADKARTPYHRLLRLWLYQALREQVASTSTTSQPVHPTLRETMLLLLHAKGPREIPDEEVRGLTRLVKLLFLASDRLGRAPDIFYAHAYGPFSDGVYDAREALEQEGLLEGSPEPVGDLPTFDQMAAVAGRKGREQKKMPVFRLSQRGIAAATKLLQAEPAYQPVLAVLEEVKREYGDFSDDELIERVYADHPEYTSESLIIGEVTARAERRRRGAG